MATNKPQEDFQKQGVRIPRSLHERLHAAAKESGRSYNSELIARLQVGLDGTADAEQLAASQAGLKTLAAVNTALALALLELGKRVPAAEKVPASAVGAALMMAEAMTRGDQLTVYKDSVVAFQDGTTPVVHLSLKDNVAQLTSSTDTHGTEAEVAETRRAVRRAEPTAATKKSDR